MVSHSYRNILAHIGGHRPDLEELASRAVAEKTTLQEEIDFLRATLDCVPDAMAYSDENGRLIMWNQAARDISHLPHLDAPPDDWGEHFRMFFPDGSAIPMEDVPLLKALRTRTPQEGNYLIESDGRRELTHIWARAVQYRGTLRGVLVWRMANEQ